MSSWRGRSGRRYIVGIHPVAEAEIAEVSEAIIIAVRRDAEGTAHVIDIATAGAHPNEQARARWASAMRSRGATEMHVHRLANGDQERRAIVDDLREDESRAS